MSNEQQTQSPQSAYQNGLRRKIAQYVSTWRSRGYPEDIPDEVPDALMTLGLAPSYKAICFALLRNDVTLQSLGFSAKKSDVYNAIKRIEIESRKSK